MKRPSAAETGGVGVRMVIKLDVRLVVRARDFELKSRNSNVPLSCLAGSSLPCLSLAGAGSFKSYSKWNGDFVKSATGAAAGELLRDECCDVAGSCSESSDRRIL